MEVDKVLENIPNERFGLSLLDRGEEEAARSLFEEERRLFSEYDLLIVACLYNSSPEDDRLRQPFSPRKPILVVAMWEVGIFIEEHAMPAFINS